MRRREFIAGLGGATVWPLATRAQQPHRLRLIGVLMPFEENDLQTRTYTSAFIQGLADLGWTDGRNMRIDVRTARNVDQVRMFAKELVDLRPDLIAVSSGPITRAVQQQTRTIPIIFMGVGDPVSGGLLESISRPEGNATGVTNLFLSMAGKWLELLKEAVPRITRVAMVFNPENSGLLQENYMALIEAAATRIAVTVTRMPVRDGADIERAFDEFVVAPDGGVIVLPPSRAVTDRETILRVAVKHRLPVIYPYKYNAAEGGLISYGSDLIDLFRRGGPSYVDRILRGAKVSELPVQFPTKFELVINLKTAKAMGLEIPPLLLVRADEVIE